MARFDLGLSFEEFEECTPVMFQALCKRRNIRIKYERLAHALTASVVANVNRSKADDPIIQPFDFIRDGESAQKKERLDAAKRFCKKVISSVPSTTPLEKILEIRGKAVKDLLAAGYPDAESIFNQCWPSLKPKKG